MDINTVIIKGRLTRDPELRYTPKGTAVADFGIAVNRKSGDKEESSFFEVKCWAKTAEGAGKFLSKGDPVLVEGNLKQERWDKEGKTHSRVVINAFMVHFLSSPKRDVGNDEVPVSRDSSFPPPAEDPVGDADGQF